VKVLGDGRPSLGELARFFLTRAHSHVASAAFTLAALAP
jgi:hypothetical protein